ncbi:MULTISPECIES: hypothetical protein [unclassified Lysinibacillus]|uniref:hypothetical protein n=1 Tax=unclassified Lysinibacillus TaxID=2636778 RepID=UPI0030F5E33F
MAEQKTAVLTTEHIEVISRAAAVVAIEQYKLEAQKEEKQRHDRRLRNVKLLLRNYRSFVKLVADVQNDIVKLDRKLIIDELDTDDFAVEAIKRSKRRTLAIIKFLDRMLNVYKEMCEEAVLDEEVRRYDTIYHLYLAPVKKTHAEIGEIQFLTERTVYNDVKKAYEDLTVLIFGVDGLRFRL